MPNNTNNMSFSFFLEDQEKQSKVSSYLDENKYTLFFEYKKELYAADEDSRVVFAKIKNADEDLPRNWKEDIKFMAAKLIPSLKGQNSNHLFSYKDLKDISCVDRDEVIKKIIKDKNYNDFRLSKE
jgi:hypothetical protein